MSSRYQKSQALLERALRVIPLGSQTFSKSHRQYPKNSAPLFLNRGLGGRVWDVDGNEYVDLVNGLLPVILGYQDKDVNHAIQQQLELGISFSLGTELEVQLAERLIDIIPCAEMVRFGKNGSDVTSAAIRLARAYTKHDRVAVCGYHGWHDWYVGSTVRNLGVPKQVSELTHRFEYNDIDSLKNLFRSYPGEFAAVIMEPMNASEPQADFLQLVKELAHKENALFILDEIITGFRFALGGAQELFDVKPDLATFGKAMGNGMPISALAGRADIMSLFEEVFFSGTFSGEALSIAAAIAVIDKMKREPVIESLWQKGSSLAKRVSQEINAFDLKDVFSLSGKPPWMILNISDYKDQSREAIRTLFIQEILAHGVLMQSSHNVSYAHDDQDFSRVLTAYHNVFSRIKQELDQGDLESRLASPALRPVFSVRA